MTTPKRLVNIKTVPNINQISFDEVSGLRIGVLALLDDIEKNAIIQKKYPILSQCAGQVAIPQIRNMGTIGGNLCQKPRCLYYRNPSFICLRKGGKTCFVIKGENRYSAIINGAPCFMVHPSDLATALVALNASVKIRGINYEKIVPIEDFFISSKVSLQKENILNSDELVSEILVPIQQNYSYGVYIKEMERKAWDFALVSVALQICFDKDIIKNTRLVLGGVSPLPFRAIDAEIIMRDNNINDDVINKVCEIALSANKPLNNNGYKIPLAKSIIKRAMLEANNRIRLVLW